MDMEERTTKLHLDISKLGAEVGGERLEAAAAEPPGGVVGGVGLDHLRPAERHHGGGDGDRK